MFAYSTFLSIKNFYKQISRKTHFFWENIFKKLSFLFFKKPIKKKDPTTEFYNSRKKRYESFCSDINKDRRNQNIHPIFYDKDAFQELLKQENNFAEQEWKRRTLIDNTPRGNIIMYYDPYKQGFVYYSDVNGIPYFILNAVAMKYVVTFSCLDFFIDNRIVEEYSSPLISIYFAEDKKKDDCAKNTKKVKINLNDAPFAKFKNYNSVNMVATMTKTSNNNLFSIFYNFIVNKIQTLYKFIFINKPKVKLEEEKKEIDNKTKEYCYNRFIHLGKMNNYIILQSVKKTNNLNGFHSKLLDGVDSESKLQKQVFNYADYKKNLMKE
jgi:hypothetical protein